LRITIKLLVESSCARDFLGGEGSARSVRKRRLLMNYLSGEVGETFARIIAPTGVLERGFADADSACNYILDQPIDTQRQLLRCFVADVALCERMVGQFHGRLEYFHDLAGEIIDDETALDRSLPVAFGVHYDEKQLADFINLCIGELERNDIIQEHLQHLRPELYLGTKA
jgi:hypothetical protein